MPTPRVVNVLFLCTHNSARSLIAESLLNGLGRGRFRAFSAGSLPSGTPNPIALDTIRGSGLSTEGLRSKSWDELAQADAPRMDFVITVCDNAEAEPCPVWPGHPATAHWGIEDPSTVQGTEEEKRHAFAKAAAILRRRIELLINLPAERLESLVMREELRSIGKQ